jgi:hypothetical protein
MILVHAVRNEWFTIKVLHPEIIIVIPIHLVHLIMFHRQTPELALHQTQMHTKLVDITILDQNIRRTTILMETQEFVLSEFLYHMTQFQEHLENPIFVSISPYMIEMGLKV